MTDAEVDLTYPEALVLMRAEQVCSCPEAGMRPPEVLWTVDDDRSKVVLQVIVPPRCPVCSTEWRVTR